MNGTPLSETEQKVYAEFLSEEADPLTDSIDNFDRARSSMFATQRELMRGQGGDTKQEALDRLSANSLAVIEQFNSCSETIFDSFGRDEAIELWVGMYLEDERARAEHLVSICEKAQPHPKYELAIRTYAQSYADAEDETRYASLTREQVMDEYKASINRDTARIHRYMPPNKNEKQAKHKKIIGAIATTAVIGITAISRRFWGQKPR